MPYYDKTLSSVLPPFVAFPVPYRELVPISNAMLNASKIDDSVHYAPNPGTHKRNQNLILRKGDGRDEDDAP